MLEKQKKQVQIHRSRLEIQREKQKDIPTSRCTCRLTSEHTHRQVSKKRKMKPFVLWL